MPLLRRVAYRPHFAKISCASFWLCYITYMAAQRARRNRENRMNDELQKALVEVINKTSKGVESGVEFLQRELPEVVQQILWWHAIHSAIFFVLGLMLLLYLPLKCRSLWQKWSAIEKENPRADVDGYVWGCAACLAGTLLGALMVLLNLTWLKILIAPKLYLIEYAASLVK